MISNILVPNDGSKAAQKAANYAVDPAKQTGAAIKRLFGRCPVPFLW